MTNGAPSCGRSSALYAAMPDRTGGSGENQAITRAQLRAFFDKRLLASPAASGDSGVLALGIRLCARSQAVRPLDNARLALHPHHDRARRGLRADLRRAVGPARSAQAHAREIRALRMR